MDQEKLNRRLQTIANLGIVAGLVLVMTELSGNQAAEPENTAPVVSADPEAPESRIRAARTRFNSALETQQLDGLATLFAPDYQLISGRGDRRQGPEAHMEMWRKTFKDDPSFNCQRTPEEVIVNADWGLAREVGKWLCTQTVEGVAAQYAGVYAAKWQTTVSSEWVLQSEVFTTLSCDGPAAACRRPDPIGDLGSE